MSHDAITRRHAMTQGAALLGGAVLLGARSARAGEPPAAPPAAPPGLPGNTTPVTVPDGRTLPWRLVDGVKVFHLVAEEVEHEFAPGLRARCWGYNGGVHGPLIEAVEGDRVRIWVTNRLPAPTTVHWHGLLLPSGMDGVSGLSQRPIPPGETFRYEFTLRQEGTFMYHAHHDEMIQIGLGLTGMFVIHPRAPRGPRPDRDFALLLHTWSLPAGARRPDANAMSDWNVLTFNGRVYPATTPLRVQRGERVRIRLGNLGPMDHHPIHLHGHTFQVTATDGGPVPESARRPEVTTLVPVGSTRTLEFVADAPGDWALHCHMTHHVMNQMGHGVRSTIGLDTRGLDERLGRLLPGAMLMGQTGMGDMEGMSMPAPANSIPMRGGQGPHGAIGMGGMFTILQVRERLEEGVDPGWYQAPPGTQAAPARAEELARDGITLP